MIGGRKRRRRADALEPGRYPVLAGIEAVADRHPCDLPAIGRGCLHCLDPQHPRPCPGHSGNRAKGRAGIAKEQLRGRLGRASAQAGDAHLRAVFLHAAAELAQGVNQVADRTLVHAGHAAELETPALARRHHGQRCAQRAHRGAGVAQEE